MSVLAAEGWLCASRRHIGGAGDILAIRPYAGGPALEARLVEVKSTTRNPWNDFGPADRRAMVETARACGAEPWLAWWPPRRELQWIHESRWPKSQSEVEFPSLDEARSEHASAVIARQDGCG